jgi:type II secretory pathway component GspD/PulD (secretin)
MQTQILERPSRSIPFTAVSSAKLITVNAVDADARNLLISIAQEAGINMVVSPDVRSRITVRFLNIPAMEAVEAIILQAGLQVAAPAISGAAPAVVFYQLPINVNDASRETIEARYGVSSEMAKFVVESRAEKPKP